MIFLNFCPLAVETFITNMPGDMLEPKQNLFGTSVLQAYTNKAFHPVSCILVEVSNY